MLLNNIQKNCVIVNIQILNKISMLDTYLMSFQTNILAAVQETRYIFTVDCSAYFYQWHVNLKHQHHFMIVFHWNQKTFKIAVINYCNTSVYVQCMMNWILQLHCDYFCVYIDDIVIYSVTLTEHVQHLWQMFEELAFKEICLLSEKFFLNYSSIYFLNQWINALKLVMVKAKLVIIINLKFLYTFTQLKKYLDMTDYLFQYISHYTVIVKLL